MIWIWWGAMVLVGFLTGCFTSWSKGGVRVFLKTLGIPILIILSRLIFYSVLPIKNSLIFAFIDFVILSAFGLLGDYVVGLRLGRNDKHGFREDPVGH